MKINQLELEEIGYQLEEVACLLEFVHVAIAEGNIAINEKKLDIALYKLLTMQRDAMSILNKVISRT